MTFATAIDLLEACASALEFFEIEDKQKATLLMHDGRQVFVPYIKREGRWEPMFTTDQKLVRQADVVTLENGIVLKNRFGPTSFD